MKRGLIFPTVAVIYFSSILIAFAITTNPPTVSSPTVFSLQTITPKVDGTSGALTQSISLDIPPGRNGLQPTLSLEYNSQNTDQDSLVGYGWTLSIPYIERLDKTGSENLYGPNAYFTSSLDGELALSSTTIANATAYAPHIDDGSFHSYAYVSSTNSWIMYDKSGTEYEFGASSQSQQSATTSTSQVYKWMIEKIIDTNGNYVRYVYNKDGNQIYPSEIVYTGHNSTDGPTAITFATSTRPDEITSLKSGFQVITNYRISQISVAFNGNTIRQYNLGYTTGNNGFRSLLSSIQESGWDDSNVETTLPSMAFSYVSATSSFVTQSNNIDGPAYVVSPVKGNGINDVSVFDLNSSSGQNEASVDGSSIAGYRPPFVWADGTYLTNPEYRADENGVRFVDINGSGKADLIEGIWNYTTSTSTNALYLNTYATSTSYAWTSTSTWNGVIPQFMVDGSGSLHHATTGIFGNIDGTGLPSYVEDFANDSGTGLTEGAYLANGFGWNSATTSIFSSVKAMPNQTINYDSRLVDINGDGLDDWEWTDGTNIYFDLNTGTGWGAADPNYTISTSSLDVVNVMGSTYYFDRGIRFVDVNGDGLPDFVHSYSVSYTSCGSVCPEQDTYSTVMLNTGNGWATSTIYTFSGYVVGDTTTGGGYAGATYNELANFNGNGQQDQDVLSTITYPRGGSTSVTYGLTTQLGNNIQLPYELLVVTKLVNHDGLGSNEETDYTYSGGLQYLPTNVFDRKFAGFASTSEATSQKTVVTYYSQGSTTTAAVAGDQSDGYGQLNHPYRQDTLTPGGTLVQSIFYQYNPIFHGNSEFVGLTRQLEQDYASDGTHRDMDTDYTYSTTTDDLIQTIAYGEVTGNSNGTFSTTTASTPRTTNVTYAASSSVDMTVPIEKTLFNNANATTTDAKYFYDGLSFGHVNVGNLTQEQDWISGTTYGSSTKTYNSFGLVTQSTDRNGNATTYSYDSFNLYPATTTNALSQSTKYTYEYSNGKVATTTNPNGGITKNIYDGVERLIEVDESDPANPSALLKNKTYQFTDNSTPPSIVHESDYLNSATTTDTYDYFDGLSRLIQQRKSTEVAASSSVTDFTYNTAGSLASQSLPYFSAGTSSTPVSTVENLFTTYAYDPLDRTLTIANAAGTTTNAYAKWTTTITDPLGNIKDFTSDAFNNLAQVREYVGTSTATTTYAYDAANDLTKLTDADGNIRDFTYDGLGREITSEDLHTPSATQFGTSTYSHDAQGNTISQTDPKGQVVTHTYDALNRMLTEALTGVGTEVTNTYDSCANGIGFLCTASSTAAKTVNAYDVLGRTSIATTTINGTAYPMSYAYDRQGNITNLTYPNGAQVASIYNMAGLVESVSHANSGGAFSSIISNFDYAPTDLVAVKNFASGAFTKYTYDPNALYRLSNISTSGTTTSSGGSSLSPSAYWKFDESSGTASDATGDGNTLTNNNTITYSSGKINNAANLVAANSQYFSIASGSQTGLDPTSGFSVSFWLKLSSLPGSNEYSVITKSNGTTFDYRIMVGGGTNNNEIYVLWSDNGSTSNQADLGEYDGPANYFVSGDVGTWVHIAVVADATHQTVTVYKNGTATTLTKRAGSNASTIHQDSVPFYIGQNAGGIRFLDGSVDESAFFKNYLLTSTDVSNLYNAGAGEQLTFGGSPGYNMLQNINYTYDNDGNITAINDLSNTVAYGTTGFSYDSLNRLISASETATTSPYSYAYSYDFLGNLSASVTTSAASTTAPTSYWKFDETSGAASDSVGGNTLTNNNTVTYTGGKVNNAAKFVRANVQYFDHVDTASLEPSTSFSVSAWFNLASSPGGNEYPIISKFQANGSRSFTVELGAEPNGVYILYTDNGSTAANAHIQEWDSAANILPATGGWHHFVAVVDAANGTCTVYIDDTVVAMTKRGGDGPITSIFNGTDDFQVGQAATGNFDGELDELRFWKNYKLTSTEVAALYNVGSFGSTVYGGTGFPNPDAVTQISNGTATTTFTYDRNGNLLQARNAATTTTYVYDYANRLIAAGINGATSTFGYDALGNRVWAITAGATTTFPSKYYSVISTASGATTTATSTEYIFSGDTLLSTISRALLNGIATGTPTTLYIHPDNLGSTNVVSDQNMNPVEVLTYYPYGGQRIASSTAGADSARKYIGQYYDAGSGLIYDNARYYNPNQGQFLSEDPTFLAIGNPSQIAQLSQQQQNSLLADPQQLNAYAYGRDNPVANKDTNGKNVILAGLVLGDVWGIAQQFDYDLASGQTSSVPAYVAAGLKGATQGGAAAVSIEYLGPAKALQYYGDYQTVQDAKDFYDKILSANSINYSPGEQRTTANNALMDVLQRGADWYTPTSIKLGYDATASLITSTLQIYDEVSAMIHANSNTNLNTGSQTTASHGAGSASGSAHPNGSSQSGYNILPGQFDPFRPH
jgi:RHS repeat-associated protein